jgi:hypothetical protein
MIVGPLTTAEASEVDLTNWCQDFDDDCDEVPCKLTCWLLDTRLGQCPYLEGVLKGA